MEQQPDSPQAVWDLASVDPPKAIAMAQRVEQLELDQQASALTSAGRGRAEYEQGRTREAIVHLERARELADEPLRGRVGVSLGAALAAVGEQDRSIELLTGLRRHHESSVAALASSQLALTHMHLGEMDVADQLLRDSLPVLEADPSNQDAATRSRVNAAYCALAMGRLGDAEEHLQRAIPLAVSTGQHLAHAASVQNLAYVRLQQGDVVSSLSLLDDALGIYESIGAPARNYSTLWDDMAEAARLAGLTADAVRHAHEARRLAEETDSVEKRADAAFRLARCLIDHGDGADGETMATYAAELFDDAHRPVWAARSRALLVETVTSDPAAELIASCVEAADQLARSGWSSEAMSLRNRTAEALMRAGRSGEAMRMLDPGTGSRDEALVATIEAAYGRALRERIAGTFDGRTLGDVRRALHEQRARFADLELRANTSAVIHRLRAIDVSHALEADEAADVIVRDESWRTAAFPDVDTGAQDDAVEDAVIELRGATSRLNGADRPDPVLEAEVRVLEQRLRHRSMTRAIEQRAEGGPPRSAGFDVAEIRERLSADAVFVHLVDCDGLLFAVDVDGSVVRQRPLGATGAVRDRLRRLGQELAWTLRVAAGAEHRRVVALLADAAALGDEIIDHRSTRQQVILSLPPSLLAFPWSLLASDAVISLTAGPTDWLRPRSVRARPSSTSLGIVVGPGLDSSSRRSDHQAIADRFLIDPGDIRAGSTCGDALDVLAACDVVHIAAHGRYRSDAPRFSSIRLDDGDLHLHEFDRLRDVADVVVIAACDAARTSGTGVAPVGVMPVLASAGVGAVLAPVTPIPDDVTVQLVGFLHERLRSEPPANALATLRTQVGPPGSLAHLTASSFVCFGRQDSMHQSPSS